MKLVNEYPYALLYAHVSLSARKEETETGLIVVVEASVGHGEGGGSA